MIKFKKKFKMKIIFFITSSILKMRFMKLKLINKEDKVINITYL